MAQNNKNNFVEEFVIECKRQRDILHYDFIIRNSLAHDESRLHLKKCGAMWGRRYGVKFLCNFKSWNMAAWEPLCTGSFLRGFTLFPTKHYTSIILFEYFFLMLQFVLTRSTFFQIETINYYLLSFMEVNLSRINLQRI